MASDDWQHLILALLSILVLIGAGLVLAHVGQVTNQKLMPETTHRHGRDVRSSGAIVNMRRSLSGAALFVQMLFTVLAASQITSLINNRTVADVAWLFLILVVIVYVTFGRALPRALYDKSFSVGMEDRYLSIGRLLTTLVRPLGWLEEKLQSFFRLIIPGAQAVRETHATEEELSITSSHDDGVIGEIEREMIDGILSLEEMTVRDIMVPRLDIVALERRVSARELIDTITAAGHSRIPVYRESLDSVLGVLYVKDLLPFVIENTVRIPLLDLIRPAFVVPESKKLPELFAELKRTRIHMAIVADEYGGTAGLITIEDILEEIVGEIQDEYDSEDPLIVQVADDVIEADGRVAMEEVEDAFGIEFEEEDDFSTLGGFVHKHLGRIAVRGDAFEAEGVRVEILEIERHRVRKMRITRIPDLETEHQDGSDRHHRHDAGDDVEAHVSDSTAEHV